MKNKEERQKEALQKAEKDPNAESENLIIGCDGKPYPFKRGAVDKMIVSEGNQPKNPGAGSQEEKQNNNE